MIQKEEFKKIHAIFTYEPFYKELVNQDGYPLTFPCAEENNVNAMRFLIQEGFDILEEVHEKTVFYIAVRIGSVELLDILLRHKPEALNRKNTFYGSILYYACAENQDNVVKFLIQFDGIDVNIQKGKSGGEAPLHLAIRQNNATIVSMLLNHKSIDVNIQIGITRETPIHIAAKQNNMKIVMMLLNHISINLNLRADTNINGFLVRKDVSAEDRATDESIKRMIRKKREMCNSANSIKK